MTPVRILGLLGGLAIGALLWMWLQQEPAPAPSESQEPTSSGRAPVVETQPSSAPSPSETDVAPAAGDGPVDPLPRIRTAEVVVEDVRDALAQDADAVRRALDGLVAWLSTDGRVGQLQRLLARERQPRVRALAWLALSRATGTAARSAWRRALEHHWADSDVERLALVASALHADEGTLVVLSPFAGLQVPIGRAPKDAGERAAFVAALDRGPAFETRDWIVPILDAMNADADVLHESDDRLRTTFR